VIITFSDWKTTFGFYDLAYKSATSQKFFDGE
jgi:hypothetical protein